MLNNLHPGLLMMAAGLLIMALPEVCRKPLSLLAPLSALTITLQLKEGASLPYRVTDTLTLDLLHVDSLTMAFLLIFAVMAVVNAIYALELQDRYETGMALVYTGSIMAVSLAGDSLSFVFFWEIAAFSAVYLIYARHCRRASRAAFRYLLMHAFGGNMLLIGVILYIYRHGTELPCLTCSTSEPAFWFVLIGVGVNAVMPPFNSWIVDAYPEATIGGTVYMSGLTSKIGIYALIRMFAGTESLLYIGVFMALYGVCMAFIENDLRRLFSYHIISQMGYMVAALAVGGYYGIDGAAAHAINNILYKGTLMMCCGAVIYATGRRKISDLGGIYKKMPVASFAFLIASLAIAGVPFLNGFASKALIMHAVEEGGHGTAALLLTLTSVGTWLSVALKVNYFVFFGKGSGKENSFRPIPRSMNLAMLLGAGSCIVLGIFPHLLYRITPLRTEGHPFTVSHIAEYLILFAGATVVFLLLRRKMAPHDEMSLDFDWIFRRPLTGAVEALSKGIYAVTQWADARALRGAQYLGTHLGNPYLWTKKSAHACVRRWSFENEDRSIGAVIETAAVMVAGLFLFAMILRG